jgi:hypothetical protein
MFFCVMEGDRGSEEMAREMENGDREIKGQLKKVITAPIY